MIAGTVNLSAHWLEIDAVAVEAHPYDVFEILAVNPDWPFVPVTDGGGRPVGVVRERRLKEYAYARYGRELIKRCTLSEFVEPALSVADDILLEDLLSEVADNPNPDGVLVTHEGLYRAVLLNPTLLRLHEERHVETKIRLANAEKLEAIGTLAGGIAHDLNNILTPIIGYTELIRESLRLDQRVDAELVDEVLISAERARQTVRKILLFSRQRDSERCEIRLQEAVREVVGLLRATVPSTVDIDLQFNAEADCVFANPAELHQVLMNLCTNAYAAMRQSGGTLTLSVSNHSGPLPGWTVHAISPPHRLLRLTVEDTGEGIEPGVLPRIFEPFYTTRAQGEGTGMGLAIVHGILVRHKAYLSVESEPGRGTRFHVFFVPLGAQAPAAAQASTTAAADDGRNLTGPVIRALVVDDESQILRLAKTVFSKYRFDVTTETDSIAAWRLFEQSPWAFDVMVTDQMMPGMKGTDLVRLVKHLRPDFPIVVCTGYAEEFSPEDARALGIRERVLKPLDYRRLALRIREWFPVPERGAEESHPCAQPSSSKHATPSPSFSS